MITGDSHMHTRFSTDSKAKIQDMIESALRKGLESVCITDHVDNDYPFHEDTGEKAFQVDLDAYFPELERWQDAYAGKIRIRKGIELGLQPHLSETYQKLVSQYPFDFVIGSVHVVHGMDPYYGEIFEGRTDEDVYRETFAATLENLDAISTFDVLGHLDYVVRYGKRQAEGYSYKKYAEEIDAILQKVIAMGKGIELNTAGWKYGLSFCHPHPEILCRYKELGGEIITIGSDAHKPEHVAYDFKKAAQILDTCGFKYYTEFQNRKPIFKQVL